MRKHINGILLLDKPIGMTSNRALQKVKYLFQAKKAGHTGSLDPIATGMLPVCFGEATKFSQFLLESDKVYCVEAKLGVATNTGDSEGEVISTLAIDGITEEKIQAVLAKWVGEIEQIPPMYSAIKHQGRPLYELARKGIVIERKSRTVRIFSLEFHSLHEDKLSFSVHCSKGTYVRTLVEDIAKDLGSCAHVTQLRRLTVTPYNETSMLTMPILEAMVEESGIESLLPYLLPIESAVQSYHAVTLSSSAAFYLKMGQPVRTASIIPAGSLVRLVAEDGKFMGIGESMPDGRIKPVRLVV